MSKINRKKLLKEPDEFLTLSDRAVRWVQKRLKLVVVSCSVVVLIIAGVLGIRAYQQHREDKAREAFAPAYSLYSPTVNQSGQDRKKLEAATASLAKITKTYGATASGLQARLALGNLYLEQETWEKAESTFRALCDEPDLVPELQPLAWRGMGQSLEGQKKYAEAAEAYQEAGNRSGPNLAFTCRLDQARVLMASADKTGAEKIYRQVLSQAQDEANVQMASQGLVSLGLDPAITKPAPAPKGEEANTSKN